jgi:hypothetical protein
MTTNKRLIISAALTVLCAAGCSGVETELGEPTDSPGFSMQMQSALVDTPDLLARVALAPDHAFEIYGAGTSFIVSETGLYGSKLSPLTEADGELGPAQLYAKLAPGQPLPRRLSAYLNDLESGRTPVLTERPSQQVVARKQAFFEDYSQNGWGPAGHCPFSWFKDQKSFYGNFCPPANLGARDKWCLQDQFQKTIDWTDEMLWETTATLCVDGGVSPFVINSVQGPHMFTQPAGTWRQVRVAECRGIFCGTRIHFGIKYDVQPGGVFQFGGYFKNQ